jgi:hypothetical protein
MPPTVLGWLTVYHGELAKRGQPGYDVRREGWRRPLEKMVPLSLPHPLLGETWSRANYLEEVVRRVRSGSSRLCTIPHKNPRCG